MKKLIYILGLIAALFLFTACSNTTEPVNDSSRTILLVSGKPVTVGSPLDKNFLVIELIVEERDGSLFDYIHYRVPNKNYETTEWWPAGDSGSRFPFPFQQTHYSMKQIARDGLNITVQIN